jgi:hypothetical protein
MNLVLTPEDVRNARKSFALSHANMSNYVEKCDQAVLKAQVRNVGQWVILWFSGVAATDPGKTPAELSFDLVVKLKKEGIDL